MSSPFLDETQQELLERVYKDGDVIVDASGEAAFVTRSEMRGDLFLRRQKPPSPFDNVAELYQLEYPVTIVARYGDPSVNIVVEKVESFRLSEA